MAQQMSKSQPYHTVSHKCTKICGHVYRVRTKKKSLSAMSETQQEVSHFYLYAAFWCILAIFTGGTLTNSS